MKKLPLALAVAAACTLSSTAMADRIKGGAKADFSTNELSIPCVLVSDLSEDTEGQYYDVVLERRGKSMNFELSFAEPEDSALCETISNFAEFHDDDDSEDEEDDEDSTDEDSSDGTDDDSSDDEDSSDDDSGDGTEDDGSDEEDSTEDDGSDGEDSTGDGTEDDSSDSTDDTTASPSMFVSCEVDSVRSQVSIEAKDLPEGEYYPLLTSGDNQLQGQIQAVTTGDVNFDFDSDLDQVNAGAESIESDFITDNAISVEIFSVDSEEAIVSDETSCL